MSASRPILLLAILFVAATFLAWYFSWFGRGLSDADISKYLADEIIRVTSNTPCSKFNNAWNATSHRRRTGIRS